MKVTRGSAKMKETKEETQNNVEMKGNEHNKCVGIYFSFFAFDVLFRKNWLNAPTGTRTHVSWSLVRRDNHYTTETHHAGNIASLSPWMIRGTQLFLH